MYHQNSRFFKLLLRFCGKVSFETSYTSFASNSIIARLSEVIEGVPKGFRAQRAGWEKMPKKKKKKYKADTQPIFF